MHNKTAILPEENPLGRIFVYTAREAEVVKKNNKKGKASDFINLEEQASNSRAAVVQPN